MIRRHFLVGATSASALAVAGCSSTPPGESAAAAPQTVPPQVAAMYAELPYEQFEVPRVAIEHISPEFWRQRVTYPTPYRPGTIVVDTNNFYLYYVEGNGSAMRYGVSLGKAGFGWDGLGVIQWKRPWPIWTPPAEMIERVPELEEYSAENGGMPPGPYNPLGARALYIFQNNVDTLYRIHGTFDNSSIGRAVSSGCVRMINQDVIDLYNRVEPGGDIIVL